jgi:hypothetical protein
MKLVIKLLTMTVLFSSTQAFAASVVLCAESIGASGSADSLTRELKRANDNGYTEVSAPTLLKTTSVMYAICVTATKPSAPAKP